MIMCKSVNYSMYNSNNCMPDFPNSDHKSVFTIEPIDIEPYSTTLHIALRPVCNSTKISRPRYLLALT